MRGPRRSVQGILLGAALALLLSASLPTSAAMADAEPSTPTTDAAVTAFDLEVEMPMRIHGPSTMEASDAGVLITSGRGTLDWSLSASELLLIEVEYWEHAAERTQGIDGPASGVRTTEHVLGSSAVTIDARIDGFTALVWPRSYDGAATLRSEIHAFDASDAFGPASIAVAPAASETPGRYDPNAAPEHRIHRLSADFVTVAEPTVSDADVVGSILGQPAPFEHHFAAGMLHSQTRTADHRLAGDLDGYLHGVELLATSATGTLRLIADERIEERPGSIYVPDQGWTGPGTHQERVYRYLQLRAGDAVLDVESVGVSTAVFAPLAGISTEGLLHIDHATGGLQHADGTAQALLDDVFLLEGTSHASLAPNPDDGRVHMTGQGTASYLRAGTHQSTGTTDLLVKASLAAAATAALAALAWKLQASGLGLALFSRVSRSAALDHEARRAIFTLVQSNPGIAAHEIVEHMGVGGSTVTYHLDVLLRTELVIAHKDGRYRRFFDRGSGRFANGRKNVVSILQNPTTASIAEAIRTEPGLVQRRIAERFGLAPSSVNWHVRRLVEAELVEKQRVSRSVALMPGPAWATLEEVDIPATTAAGQSLSGAVA